MSDQTPIILAVDDLQDNLDLICEVLDADSYQVITASDGVTALQLASWNPPDVAILDVEMPNMDGYELCRRLRESIQMQALPVIFLTAQRTSSDDAVRGLDAGGCDYVTKPFEADELRARVRAAVRQAEQHRQDISNTKRIVRRLSGR